MTRLTPAVVFVWLLATSMPAAAATVQALSGQVFIDRGQGYAAVSGAASANAGDVVMVLANGSGEVIYEDGCRQPVEFGAVVVIGAGSPCALADSSGGNNYLLVGSLAVAGVVGAAIALSGGDDECITKCDR